MLNPHEFGVKSSGARVRRCRGHLRFSVAGKYLAGISANVQDQHLSIRYIQKDTQEHSHDFLVGGLKHVPLVVIINNIWDDNQI